MFSFAIDFDEVLADVGAYTLAHYNLLHPQFPLEPKDITSFYWEELSQSAFQTREESILFCRSVINNQDINDIVPVHGAIDGIKNSQIWVIHFILSPQDITAIIKKYNNGANNILELFLRAIIPLEVTFQ